VVLDAFGLSKSYRSKTALEDFSLSMERRKIHGILGPNGSGKTACLHILTGSPNPSAGTVTIAGKPIESKESRSLPGFVPDDFPLPSSLNGTTVAPGNPADLIADCPDAKTLEDFFLDVTELLRDSKIRSESAETLLER